ncbi:Kunitz family trypsin and protease inhibitor protein [Raphanus sativus]|uniref:Kunitz trypsin inhibitor 2-like n=1 Tax=Raphanus sativus TaxID=3726 RepID=A0A9W3D9F1_RAPSA|nr:kunitz trypsin inhibitor 2-like [Raphanus sativus]XP_056860405.1 kunitz trypsin inhibitor 2-like [Raphanus sativus]KAJ4909444.1 Kunitz family trypsin and protease inhibitor protein [Raphanus sativus]
MKISFLITLLLATVACTHGQEPVKDTAGNSLETGQQYFIRPIKTASLNGGGLVPAAIKFPPCPLGINQALFPFLPGQPLSFQFADSVTEPIVKTSTDVTIEFNASKPLPLCNEFSFIWEVESSSASEPAILLGGIAGSQNSRFKIEKAGEGLGENTYKLTSLDGTVGSVPGFFGAPKLVLTNDDAKTIFVKFNKYNEATTSASRVEKSGLRMFPF